RSAPCSSRARCARYASNLQRPRAPASSRKVDENAKTGPAIETFRQPFQNLQKGNGSYRRALTAKVLAKCEEDSGCCGRNPAAAPARSLQIDGAGLQATVGRAANLAERAE